MMSTPREYVLLVISYTLGAVSSDSSINIIKTNPLSISGTTGVQQRRDDDVCGSGPRLHPEQEDQECSVGSVQFHFR